jgi:hypothetical protein
LVSNDSFTHIDSTFLNCIMMHTYIRNFSRNFPTDNVRYCAVFLKWLYKATLLLGHWECWPGKRKRVYCKHGVATQLYGVDFNNMFMHSFYVCRSHKSKRQSSHQCPFLLFGSLLVKVASKMLVKSSHGLFQHTLFCRNKNT